MHHSERGPRDRHLLSSGPVAAAALFRLQHEPWSVCLLHRLMTEITLKSITRVRNCLISQLFVSNSELGNFSSARQALQCFYSVHIWTQSLKSLPKQGKNACEVLWLLYYRTIAPHVCIRSTYSCQSHLIVKIYYYKSTLRLVVHDFCTENRVRYEAFFFFF